MPDLFPDVPSMLAAHSIDAEERPLAHNGFSGARISTRRRGGETFLLKRIAYADDWIMRATHDAGCREGMLAASPLAGQLPRGIATPSLSAARDGESVAILMRDVSPWLLPDDKPVDAARCDALLRALAELHAAFWDDPLADAAVPWCGVRDRLMLLSPDVGRALVDEGRDFGLARGWRAFDDHAPDDARRLAQRLFDDPAPLLRIADALPPTLLHGDVKFANVAVDLDGGVVWLFDWALVMRAPAGLEFAWFPAVNTPQLPWPAGDVLERYAEHLRAALGPRRFAEAGWPAQRALAAIGALLLMGWAKALDHEDGRPHELTRLCTTALEAARTLSLP